ncbi:unnamed protein product, partial [Clonostachys rosea f. rosea IK726]
SSGPPSDGPAPVPLSWKLASVLLVTLICFGSKWSSGITAAMKTTMKKELKINNTQFALLEASEDFMTTCLILVSGLVTDRIGGARAILYGNAIYSVGSILVAGAAQTRSYKFMIVGRIISALVQGLLLLVRPGNGFASTLGLELGIGKIGAFAGKSSSNIIAKKTGNFAWVFWVAVFMNLFTNIMTGVFYWFTKAADRKYAGVNDPATGEKLAEKSKKLEIKKVLQMPWPFWCVLLFSLFETSAAIVFSQNATELAEQRFKTDSIAAGWYSSLSQYAGFFIVPILGVFIDVCGHRVSTMVFCGTGVFIAMLLVTFSAGKEGAAASFVYAPACGTATTSATAYALKIMMNNSMNIIVRVITGRIQDADNNSTIESRSCTPYWPAALWQSSLVLILLSWRSIDLRQLQWGRKKRITRGDLINERKARFWGEKGETNKKISMLCFSLLCLLTLGGWVAYFWGVATGNN